MTYALRPPTLPAELTFNASLQRIEGTPTETAKTRYVWTATDADGDVAAHRFTIEVTRGICNRTPWLRNDIVAAIDGVTDCADVTLTHLGAITSLSVNRDEHINAETDILTGPDNGDFAGLGNLNTLRADIYSYLIADGLLSPLINLHTLIMHNSDIIRLDAGVFDRLSNLRTLSLASSEHLSQLEMGVFDRLSHLTSLEVTETRLARLDAGLFDRLSNLQNLNLANNQFAVVDPEVFRSLTRLRTLNFSGSLRNVADIDPGLFAGLTNLRVLHLRGLPVALPQLPPGLFDGLNLTDALWLDRRVGNRVRARIDEAAPRELRVNWTATGGSTATGTAVIPAGRRTSAPFGMAGAQPITYTLSNPNLTGVTEPTDDAMGSYTGFRLVASADSVILPIRLSFGAATVSPQSYIQGRTLDITTEG